MNVVAIIQARKGSTRLANKISKIIAGKTILQHVVTRVCSCKLIDQIVVATTQNSVDNDIFELLTLEIREKVSVFRGSTNNVLDRYYQCAKAYDAEIIVRVTSDSPLVDPSIINRLLKLVSDNNYDYASNSLIPSMPDGLDVECFSFKAVEYAWKHATLYSHREHVTPYIRINPEIFKLANLASHHNYSQLCWAIDTQDDLIYIREIAKLVDINDINNYFYQNILNIIMKVKDKFVNKKSIRDSKLIQEIPEIFVNNTNISKFYL